MHKAIFAIAGVLLLSGCNKAEDAFSDQPAGGRYHGVGIVEAGQRWRAMKLPDKSADKDAATFHDDEHIIVTVDGRTGELRQCGDHSGICVSMNPWTRPAAANAPVPVSQHYSDAALTAASDEK